MLDFLKEWETSYLRWSHKTREDYVDSQQTFYSTTVKKDDKGNFSSSSDSLPYICEQIEKATNELLARLKEHHKDRENLLQQLGDLQKDIGCLQDFNSEALLKLMDCISECYKEMDSSLKLDKERIRSLHAAARYAFYRKLENKSELESRCHTQRIDSGYLNDKCDEAVVDSAIRSMDQIETLIKLREIMLRNNKLTGGVKAEFTALDKKLVNLREEMSSNNEVTDGEETGFTALDKKLDEKICQNIFTQAVALEKQHQSFIDDFSQRQKKMSQFIELQKTFKSSSYRMFERRTSKTIAIDKCLQGINDFLRKQAIKLLVPSDDSTESTTHDNGTDKFESLESLKGKLTVAITDWLENRQQSTLWKRFNIFHGCCNTKKLSSRHAAVEVLNNQCKQFQVQMF
jgi:hypothetical protein